MDGATTLGTGTLSAGNATLSTSFSSAGTHNLSATYEGDANNATSTSTVLSETVYGALTTTLATSANPATVGQSVTLTANVTGTNPSGTVTFKDGATTLGTGTVGGGTATLNTQFSTTGVHSLSAVYEGDANNPASGSSSVAVNVLGASSSVALSVSANPVQPGQSFTVTATVTGNAPTGTVTFRDGANVLGSASVVGGQATVSSCRESA